MAKEFTMGARLRMKDDFSKPVNGIKKSSDAFRSTVVKGDEAIKKFGRSTETAGRQTEQFGRKSGGATPIIGRLTGAVGGLARKLFSLPGLMAAAFAGGAILKMRRWLVDSLGDMETYRNTLTVILGSQEDAVRMLEWATKFAASTPFQIPQIMEATTMLQSYGMQADKTLGIVGDMASVMGKDLLSAVQAVANAQTGELEMLKRFGITKGMIADQAKLLGANPINKAGQITDVKAFNAALFSLMEKRFKGGMEMQSKTWKGMLSNVSDFTGEVGRMLGAPIFEALKVQLRQALDWFIEFRDSGQLDVWVAQVHANLAKAGAAWDTYVKPPLRWVFTVGLPLVGEGLKTVGKLAASTADWFNRNWETVGPIVYGLAIAWGTYYAVTKTIAIATKTWTAVQWALNVAMAANPVGLLITGIGLLIGAGILLVKNWDKVKDFMDGFFGRAFDYGRNFIAAIGDGIAAGKDYIVDKVKGVFTSIRQLLPFSDAKKGPFSQLTYSGRSIMSTMAAGIRKQEGTLHNAMGSAFDRAPGVTLNGVDPAGYGKQGSGRVIHIAKLIESFTVQAADGQTAEGVAEAVIRKLHDLLDDAADILDAGELGALL